jgi:membrane protease YdiL (CAAX protease family)
MARLKNWMRRISHNGGPFSQKINRKKYAGTSQDFETSMTMNTKSVSKSTLIEKHPLILFFVFAYFFFFVTLLSIGLIKRFVPISDTMMQVFVAIASWTPNLAAILVVWKSKGRKGVFELLAGWKKWRVSILWYLLGILPIGIALFTAGISSLLDGMPLLVNTSIRWSVILSMVIFHTLQGATGEELGWRGYGLPKLEERYGTLVSALLLGLLIAGWHSILHLLSPIGVPEWQFWIVIICYSVIIAFIYNQSAHSLLIVSLFHFAFNFSLELVTTRLALISLSDLFSGYVWIYSILALVIIILGGRKFIRSGPRET